MSSNFFVNQTNPEIFSVIPRPGGIANITLPERPKRRPSPDAGSKTQVGSKTRTGSRSQTGSKIRGISKAKSATSRTSAGAISKTSTTSKKSLLTVSTAYDAPVDLDVDSCPREYKVKQIIAATPWSVEFDEYLEPPEDLKRIPDPFQDAVDMLAMTISVIMLLSRSYKDITDSHFKWVLSYLKCIRDEFDQTPPNVQGILNHINQVTGGRIKSFLEDEYEPPELGDNEKGVRISTAPPEVAATEPAT